VGIDRQVAYHDAAFTVIGRVLGVAIRPPAPRRGLRVHEGAIFPADNDRSPEGLETMATIALAGRAALARIQDGLKAIATSSWRRI
jgi:hypothetical protein